NTEVQIIHDDKQPNKPGETGECILRSEMMIKRYYNKPEETAKTLINGWLYTGDLATIDEEGFITLVDRKKDMIITGGENVYSVQVEEIIYDHPDVLEVAIVGETDDVWGEKVVAVVVPKAGKTIQENALKTFCRERLAGYKVPVKYITTTEIPRNASGKVLKYQLRESLKAQAKKHMQKKELCLMSRTYLNEEHDMFRKSLQKFLEKEAVPYYDQWEKDKAIPRSFWRKCGEQGFLCPQFDEAYGGSNADFGYAVVLSEEMEKVGTAMVGLGLHNDIVMPYIDYHGTEEQKARWMPKAVTGEYISAIAMTEPGVGS